MSRCFPFPPPGYARDRHHRSIDNNNEALILSIKLQKENEKANSDMERKKGRSSEKEEKKREKKEKKREKEKRHKEDKSKYSSGGEKKKLAAKLYQTDPNKVEPTEKHKLREEEKSGVTEELGQPIVSQNVSCSSDSTGNSGKRKRQSMSPNGIQSHGNVVRIRFSSSRKTDDPNTSGRKELETHLPSYLRDDPCTSHSKVRPFSNLVRAELSGKQPHSNLVQIVPSAEQRDAVIKPPCDGYHCASTSSASLRLAPPRQLNELSCLPEKKVEPEPTKQKVEPEPKKQKVEPEPKKQKLSHHEKKMLKEMSQYSTLFESLVPPQLLSEPAFDDDEWLFGKKVDERPAKSLKVEFDSSVDNVQSCSSAAVFQPRGQLLPDVQIYALPFTVPF